MSTMTRPKPAAGWDWHSALTAGRLAMNEGANGQAEAWIRQAVAGAEAEGDLAGKAEALNSLGVLLSRLGRHEEAEAVLRTAIDADRYGDIPSAYAARLTNLGHLLTKAGRTEEAEAVLRAALARISREDSPVEWASAHNNLGSALAVAKRWDEAVGHFRLAADAIRTSGRPTVWQHTDFLVNLGLALMRTGSSDEGIATLREALHKVEFAEGVPSDYVQRVRAAIAAAKPGAAASGRPE
jgi:tetratricopeptide (TPR) repeat protein